MPRPDELPNALTIEEVADILDLAPSTVKRLAYEGHFEWYGQEDVANKDITTASLVEYVNKKYGDGGTAKYARRKAP